MPYEFYRSLHLFAAFLLFSSLGGLAMLAMAGGENASPTARKFGAITHGVALFLVLLGGFGTLARLGMAHGGLPGWVHAKLGLWLLLGAAMVIPKRLPQLARPLFLVAPVLGAAAAWIGHFKPF